MAETTATDPDRAPAAQGGPTGQQEGLRRCDFCGEPSDTVRRVALDRDYDRLRTRQSPLYACPACSEAKERRRQEGRPTR